MKKLLKVFGFTNCFLCNKLIHKSDVFFRRFADSPKDFESGGYKAPVCKRCDCWCEEHQGE